MSPRPIGPIYEVFYEIRPKKRNQIPFRPGSWEKPCFGRAGQLSFRANHAVSGARTILSLFVRFLMATHYLIRFDDVTPGMAWTRFQPFEDLARELRLPYLLGVVPDCRDVKLMVEPSRLDFWAWVRRMKGQGATIAQHGFTHIYETDRPGLLGIGRKSEFAGLAYQVQYDRLARGKEMMQGEGVWDGVFMAPSHSFDASTIRALKALGFRGITDGFGFFPYEIEGLKAVPQLFARPIGFGIGVETICIHANTLTDERSAMLIEKFRALHSQIISFDDALRVRASSPALAEGLRISTRLGLQGLRLLRSAG